MGRPRGRCCAFRPHHPDPHAPGDAVAQTANLHSAADALLATLASYPKTATDAFVRGKVCSCGVGVK